MAGERDRVPDTVEIVLYLAAMTIPPSAMLLAAGYGTRLQVLTEQRPKPMIPVCDVPLVRWAAAHCAHHGVRRAVVNLHHLGEQIQREMGSGGDLGLDLAYAPEPAILGTGGGMRAMAGYLPRGTVIGANAKQTNDPDLGAALTFHHKSRPLATLVLRPVASAGHARAIRGGAGGRTRWIL